MLSLRRSIIILPHSSFMMLLSSCSLPYSCTLHLTQFRLAVNYDWLLEEGWGLYLVSILVFCYSTN